MAVIVGPLLEDVVHRGGLIALQQTLGTAGLLHFPKRANGTPQLLRQSFFERVLGDALDLVDFAPADISAAQTDVRYLNLVQLLHIRCKNLNFSAPTPSMRTHADFLQTLDDNIEKRVVEKCFSGDEIAGAEDANNTELFQLVVLIYGIHQQVDGTTQESSRWLVRTGALEAVLSLADCLLLPLQSGEQPITYCHRNLSRASVAVPRQKRKLEWEVELSREPAAFDSTPPQRPSERRATRPVRSLNTLGDVSSCRNASMAAEVKDRATGDDSVKLLAELHAARESMQASAAEREELSRELEVIRRVGEEANSASKKAQADMASELDLLRGELKSAGAQAEKEQGEAACTATAVEKLRGELADKEQELAAMETARADVNSELDCLFGELKAAEADMAKERKESAEAKCARERLHNELAAKEQELSAQKYKNAEMALAHDEKTEEDKVDNQEDEVEEPNNTIISLQGELATQHKELILKEEEKAAMACELNSMRSELEAMGADGEKEKKEAAEAIDALEKLRDELVARDKSLAANEQEKANMASQIDSLHDELTTTRVKFDTEEKLVAETERTLTELRDEIVEKDQELAEKERVRAGMAIELDNLRSELRTVAAKGGREEAEGASPTESFEQLRNELAVMEEELAMKKQELTEMASELECLRGGETTYDEKRGSEERKALEKLRDELAEKEQRLTAKEQELMVKMRKLDAEERGTKQAAAEAKPLQEDDVEDDDELVSLPDPEEQEARLREIMAEHGDTDDSSTLPSGERRDSMLSRLWGAVSRTGAV